MIAWHDVTAVATKLVNTPSASQTLLLNLVNNVYIVDGVWGDPLTADAARAYLAAHLGTLALLGGAGHVTEEAVGQLSRKYATILGIKGSLGLTSYGAEYWRLVRLLPTALGLVG